LLLGLLFLKRVMPFQSLVKWINTLVLLLFPVGHWTSAQDKLHGNDDFCKNLPNKNALWSLNLRCLYCQLHLFWYLHLLTRFDWPLKYIRAKFQRHSKYFHLVEHQTIRIKEGKGLKIHYLKKLSEKQNMLFR